MGGSQSKSSAPNKEAPPPPVITDTPEVPPVVTYTEPPPKLKLHETFSERLWRKTKAEPLVPIGACLTSYFLFRGIKSVQGRDPILSQKMMRARIAAQFGTLCCLIFYMGQRNGDWRLAPFTQDKWKQKAEEKKLQAQQSKQTETASSTQPSSSS